MAVFRRCSHCSVDTAKTTLRRCPGCGRTWTWAFRVTVSREGSRRVQRRGSGFATRAEAAAAERAMLASVEEGRYVRHHGVTVGAFMDEWLAAVGVELKPNTLATYRDVVRAHVKPTIGHVPLRQLAARHVVEMRDHLLARGSRKGGPLAPQTVKHAMVVLSAAMKYAVVVGMLPANPVSGVPAPRVPRGERRETWVPAQLRAFLEGTADDDMHAAWVVAASTGMRRGELAGIRWPDVDLDRCRLFVGRGRVSSSAGKVLVDDEKSESSRRWVQLDAVTCEVLRAHRAKWEAWREAAGAAWQGDEDEYLFVWRDGRAVHPDRFTRWFRAKSDDLGLPYVKLHGLRHTWATLALSEGVDVLVVSRRLGHASTAVTQGIYQHVPREVDADAAARVAGSFLGPVDEAATD